MRWSGRWGGTSWVLLVLMTAGSVGFGASARAQQDEPEPPGVLGEMVGARTAANQQAVDTQDRIDVVSDETGDLLARYRTALKQIDAIDLYNQQMRDLIESQQTEVASLEDQISRVQQVSRNVTPLMVRMIAALGKFVDLDVPFLLEERTERVARLRAMMKRSDVTTPEKFRQIMEAYETENEYGRTIEAYRDALGKDGREITVDFLRFGRVALVYLSLDESEAGVWSQQKHDWVALDRRHHSAIRQGLRIARRQAAPDLIRLPLPVAVDAGGAQ